MAGLNPRSNTSKPSGGERLSRIVVAITTCLGGLGLFALLYFPLRYLE